MEVTCKGKEVKGQETEEEASVSVHDINFKVQPLVPAADCCCMQIGHDRRWQEHGHYIRLNMKLEPGTEPDHRI